MWSSHFVVRSALQFAIEGAPVCNAAARFVEKMIAEMFIHTTVNIVDVFAEILVILQTTIFLDLRLMT